LRAAAYLERATSMAVRFWSTSARATAWVSSQILPHAL
jgi:hypothetical protein